MSEQILLKHRDSDTLPKRHVAHEYISLDVSPARPFVPSLIPKQDVHDELEKQYEKRKPYYTAVVAFSTPSGRLHVGHALGQVAAHVTALYESMKHGQQVFFPFGIHATGKDIFKIIDDLKQDPSTAQKYLLDSEAAERIINAPSRADSVDTLINHFKDQYIQGIEHLGIPIARDSFFSTHQKDYFTFTQWTLRKLDEMGLVIKTRQPRPYCEDCDDIKAIEQDQAEVIAIGKTVWNDVRIENGKILGGPFFCRVHPSTALSVAMLDEYSVDYGNPVIQERTLSRIKGDFHTFPQKYKQDLEGIVKSRHEKPMERDGEKNLGTPSPFHKGRSIEALSDSNIYMEYYPIALALHHGVLAPENLNDALYDYLYLNKGTLEDVSAAADVSPERILTVKKLIVDRFPLDLNVAGKEHSEVHFPFSLFTHTAVLPERLFPHEYMLTAHLTRNGDKMSKSKGNVLYMDDAISHIQKRYINPGVSPEAFLDSIRFFLMNYQTLDKDFDWNDEVFEKAGINRVFKYVKFINTTAEEGKLQNNNSSSSKKSPEDETYDRWLSTKAHDTFYSAQKDMDQRQFRHASITLFDNLTKDISTYLSSNPAPNQTLVGQVISDQLRMLSPFMPRLTQELHESHFGAMPSGLPSPNAYKTYSEEHDRIAYALEGKEFVNNQESLLQMLMGKLYGKKLIDRNLPLEIYAPSTIVKEIIEKSTLPSLKGMTLDVRTDPAAHSLYVKQGEKVYA